MGEGPLLSPSILGLPLPTAPVKGRGVDVVGNIALGLGSVLTGDGDSVKDVAMVEKRKNLNGKRERRREGRERIK